MSKIVDSYIKLNESFKLCTKNQFEGNINFADMSDYHVALDDFIKASREHYSNEELDIYSAINLFNSDLIAQEELKQYEVNENSSIKKK